jgi:hypothetical protein
MDAQEKELWQEMYELTAERCRKTCKLGLGFCCKGNDALCEMAVASMIKHGETPPERIRDDDGRCLIPPHYRQICTLHQCAISSLGFAADDQKWTDKYYDLRRILLSYHSEEDKNGE